MGRGFEPAIRSQNFGELGFQLVPYAGVVVLCGMDGWIDVFAVPGGWKFRLPNGYVSHSVFEEERMANHCGEVAFYRHEDNPQWMYGPQMALSQQVVIGGYGDLGVEIKPHPWRSDTYSQLANSEELP